MRIVNDKMSFRETSFACVLLNLRMAEGGDKLRDEVYVTILPADVWDNKLCL